MYCQVSEVRERVPDITSEYISDAAIVRFIGFAEAEINAILSRLYEVPFTGTVPTVVAELCADLAVIRTMTTFPDRNFDEDLTRLIERTNQTKEDLSTGIMYLGTDYTISNTVEPGFYYSATSTIGDHITDSTDRGL